MTTKITLFFTFFLFAISCKKDDVKPSSSVANATISLSSSSQVIAAPTGLATSHSDKAQTVMGYIDDINGMTSFFNYLKVPGNAVKSTIKITASNGRIAAAGDFQAYTWYDAQSGDNIAYQVSETTDSFLFELFLQNPGQTVWLKYFYAEEKKDKSAGTMAVLDIFGLMGADLKAKWLDYSWTIKDNTMNLNETDNSENSSVQFSVDLKTYAGSVTFAAGGIKESTTTWDNKGNGSWTEYNTNGTVEDSGTWTN